MQTRPDQLIVHNIKTCHTIKIIVSKINKGKWLPATGNNFLIFGSVPYGQNDCLWCPLTACITNSCHRWFWNLKFNFPGWKSPLFLLFDRNSCHMHHDLCCLMPIAAFSITHVCPFKYCMCEYEVEQIPFHTTCLHWGELKQKNTCQWNTK